MKKILFSIILFLVISITAFATNPYRRIELKIIRTFDEPIVITLTYQPDSKWLFINGVIYDGKGGYDWGKIETSTFNRIEKERFEQIATALDEIDFHSIYKNSPKSGLDGSTWVISASRSGSGFEYTFWYPTRREECQPIVDFALMMLESAEIDIEKTNLY